MKITVRLILSLLLVATVVASFFTYLQFCSEKKRLTDELERRALILAESFQETIKEIWGSQSPAKLKRFVKRFGNRERLIGIIVYNLQGEVIASSPGFSSKLQQPLTQVMESVKKNQGISSMALIEGKRIHRYAVPLFYEDRIVGALLLFHDASYIDMQLEGIWRNNFMRLLTLAVLMTLVTVVIVRWSITGPISQFVEWLKGLRTGKMSQPSLFQRGDILTPLAEEITQLAKTLAIARAAAEEEARLRLSTESLWTAERLKEYLRLELRGKTLYVISNREPYMHIREGQQIKWIIPAGGIVTALDPVLRMCGGVWIAHGSGDADMDSSDPSGKLQVPPDKPSYTLKRVWLTKEEEEGYYYGFANEGIWPLCHITHTRPIFRRDDWIHYQKVNEKFLRTLLDEISGEESPLVLVQDYHFSLLPLLIKSKRPDTRLAIFWHIPWPNPESFSICPWKKEILIGLLGADLIGFQTQFHCNNFLETIDRFLESKINWEEFSIERNGHLTQVKPFPISIAFPDACDQEKMEYTSGNTLKESLFREIGLTSNYLGIGVDRIDYTKGIVERFQAIERFLEKYKEFKGKFTFVELGAPSRTHIKRYHDLIAEVEETTDRINWRFQTKEWKPLVFLKGHHDHKTINHYYQAADFCMVTSLHDGMNLVAKEFVAARHDEDGVLILSQFTGASRELHDALIVNPYDIEEMAEAIHTALTMHPSERTLRMRNLRGILKERNIYRWAANLITELVRLRVTSCQ